MLIWRTLEENYPTNWASYSAGWLQNLVPSTSISLRLQPLDMRRQTVQVGKERKTINTIFVECPPQGGPHAVGDTRRDIPGNEFAHLPVPAWVCILLYTNVGLITVGLNHTVIFAWFSPRKVTRNERIVGPVQQACGPPVLLTERQPVPVAR